MKPDALTLVFSVVSNALLIVSGLWLSEHAERIQTLGRRFLGKQMFPADGSASEKQLRSMRFIGRSAIVLGAMLLIDILLAPFM